VSDQNLIARLLLYVQLKASCDGSEHGPGRGDSDDESRVRGQYCVEFSEQVRD
jgi:hypothetical protein